MQFNLLCGWFPMLLVKLGVREIGNGRILVVEIYMENNSLSIKESSNFA